MMTQDTVMPTPTVPVFVISATTLAVLCPFCRNLHFHGTSIGGSRRSDCSPGGSYRLGRPVDVTELTPLPRQLRRLVARR